jgi:hypothetical protein
VAWTKAFAKANVLGQAPNPAAVAMNSLLAAYFKHNAEEFNSECCTWRRSC